MELPNMSGMRPPGSPQMKQKRVVPGTANLWSQYEQFQAKQKKSYPKPPYVSNVLKASSEAMKNIRSVDGRKVPSLNVSRYENMRMSDFEKMREEKGLEAVENFVKSAEYERLGGR